MEKFQNSREELLLFEGDGEDIYLYSGMVSGEIRFTVERER